MADAKEPIVDPNNANKDPDSKDLDPKNPDPKEPDPKTPDPNKEGTVPHGAFHQEREKRKAAEKKVEEMEAKIEADGKKVLEEQGKFKDLYEEEKTKRETAENSLTDVNEKLTKVHDAIDLRVDSSLKGIDNEEDRTLAKSLLEGKSHEQKETLLPQLMEKFGGKTNMNSSVSGGKTTVTKQSEASMAELKKDMDTAVKEGRTKDVMKIQRKIRDLKAA